ncbi:hypothetical protein [Rothia sp. P7208]|uniref:hypothetical protein n=1 Tax=Rothia sp. P7208 TaxID=3402660 RepID=UPI003AC6188D
MIFREIHQWAVLPKKHVADLGSARERRQILRQNFVHLRAERQPQFCPPWVQGATLGWRIFSPIDVTLSPLDQIEIAGGDFVEASARAVGKRQIWTRGDATIALDPPSWLNSYEFETDDGNQSMFLPNGLGTIEWRQGWTVEGWDDFGLLIVPSPQIPNLGVEIGLLSPATLERIMPKGISIAVAPRCKVEIRRGDEIARLIPISRECMSL